MAKERKKYDAKYYREHKLLYALIVIVDLLVVCVPMIGYIFLFGAAAGRSPEQPLLSNGFETLLFFVGLLGAAGVVFGLANIWMSVLDQYRGHKFTLWMLLGGSLICGLTLLLLSMLQVTI